MSSSRPAMEALPDSSRRTSTRWRVFLACSLRVRDGLGVEFHLQGGGLAAELVDPQAGGGGGEDLVGAGGVGVGQEPGGGGDRVGPGRADGPVGHPGQRLGEAAGELEVGLDPPGGLVAGDQQLGRELVVGELPGAAALRDTAGPGVGELGGAAAGVLRDQRRLLPLRRGPPVAGRPAARRSVGRR